MPLPSPDLPRQWLRREAANGRRRSSLPGIGLREWRCSRGGEPVELSQPIEAECAPAAHFGKRNKK
jgi:hypothetical protein